jgi:small subunit ribosomal protein S14
MARKALIEKQNRRQILVNRNWEKREHLKKMSLDPSLSEEERHAARIKLNKMSPNTSPVRLRNRCVKTGRCRGYLRKFKLSRLCFRELSNAGKIPGITKASW